MRTTFDEIAKMFAVSSTRRRLALRGLAALGAATHQYRVTAGALTRLDASAPSLTGPKLSDIGVEDVTPSSAMIVWTTSEPADSTVQFGATTALGSAVTDPEPVTAHRIQISGLLPDVEYHYRVQSRSAGGIHATRADRMFRTTSDAHLPEAYVGVWSGIGEQSAPFLAMTVSMTLQDAPIGSVAGTVQYQSRGCYGEFTLTGVDDHAIELAERIEEGADVCPDGGRLTLIKNRTFLRSVWTGPSGDPVITSLLAHDPVGGDVAMFQANPARTGLYPGHGPGKAPEVLWRYQTGAQIYSTPVIANGVVYLNSFNGSLSALDALSGQVIWLVATTASYDGAALVVDGLVISEAEGFAFGAFDALSGQQVWRLGVADGLGHSAPVAVDGTMYFADAWRTVYAADVATGSVIWQSPVPKDQRLAVVSAPAVDGGRVFLNGSYGGAFYALDAASGALLWQTDTQPEFAMPVVSGSTVYVGGFDGMYALDVSSGDVRWHFAYGSCSTPAIAGGTIFFGTNDGHVIALDASSGDAQWSFQTENVVAAAPTIVGSSLYIGGFDGTLYALDTTTGQEQWRYVFGGPIYSSATVAGGMIYIGAEDGYIYALA